MSKKLILVPNLEKREAVEACKDLAENKVVGFSVCLFPQDARLLNLPQCELEGSPREEDVVVVLGGDGTVLRAIKLLGENQVPILGVNFGKVGFLSEVESWELKEALNRLIAGDYRVESRMMLEVRARNVAELSLNEAVIGRGGRPRPIKIEVLVDNTLFGKFLSDGLIMATPTGSTAYSFSAGGPLVSPQAEVILCSLICPYSLFNRPFILNGEESLKARLVEGEDVELSVDGRQVSRLSVGEEVSVRRADKKAFLVRLDGKSFYKLFREKMIGESE